MELITHYFGDFTPKQLQQFVALDELYKNWNSKINVISRKDEDSLYEKHILHSLSIAAIFDFEKNMNVLDIGTGGGFPGIPLAIFFPEVQFYLADSIGKKIKVVQAVAEAVGLTNVSAHHTRVEEIKNKKFDVVVSRAVASLGDLWRWSKPLLKKRGEGRGERGEDVVVPNGLICLKGGDLAQEISDSGSKPRVMEVYEIFDREVFREKYVLYVPV
ncbi:MAG: 16S rRNA (guanine(527)-N(7))-methyltransferase RsmG [Chitinophagaceae bacterium]|nr:16S rRNA (guanine(527)-N(7))-methyltransferase RsmG [Chitinophagaceae bacterium]